MAGQSRQIIANKQFTGFVRVLQVQKLWSKENPDSDLRRFVGGKEAANKEKFFEKMLDERLEMC